MRPQVNESMVQEATRNLRRVDPSEERFEVVHVGPGSEYGSKSPFDGIQFDMIVSEILGTLAMSENMCKYLSHYARHLQTFGEERRVYMVPCEARQYFGLRAFDRDELGEPLGSLLRHALESEARGKLVPSNSGGLSLDLALYPSTPVGARLEFHRERYDRLVEQLEKGKSAFATEQPTSKHTYDLRGYDPTEHLVLGVLEWQVTLWRHVELAGELVGEVAGELVGRAAPVRSAHTHELHNTIDAYAALDLRNQVARGSAWGLFVVGVPRAADSGRRYGQVRVPLLNPTPYPYPHRYPYPYPYPGRAARG